MALKISFMGKLSHRIRCKSSKILLLHKHDWISWRKNDRQEMGWNMSKKPLCRMWTAVYFMPIICTLLHPNPFIFEQIVNNLDLPVLSEIPFNKPYYLNHVIAHCSIIKANILEFNLIECTFVSQVQDSLKVDQVIVLVVTVLMHHGRRF